MQSALRRCAPLMLSLVPGFAFAHPAADHAIGFVAGIAHPFGGWDHLLAMAAVGMLAARLKGHAIWLLPLAFVSMLAFGVCIGLGNSPSVIVEIAISASVVAFGLLLAAKQHANVMGAVALVGTFALAHGYAHGAEASVGTQVTSVSGMLLASAALHVAGIAVVALLSRTDERRSESLVRLTGTAVAIAGTAMLIG